MDQRVISVLLAPVALLAWLRPRPAEARALAQPPDDEVAGEGASEVPSEDADEEPGEESPVEEAERLFDEGAAKFETADYAGAIELWTEAYGNVPNLPEYASIKAKLIANLASAHERAYDIDDEVGHLNQARVLLESYRDAIGDIYPSAAERDKEFAWVAERVAEIDAELRAIEERAAAARAAMAESQAPPPPPPGRGLVIGGSVLTALGVGGLGMMVGGMVLGQANDDISDLPTNDFETRAERFSKGRLGNTLAIAGGVGGAVLLGAGVALIVVGLNKNRAAAADDEARVTLVPALGPAQLGVGVVGRF